jgi:hypothetical protein
MSSKYRRPTLSFPTRFGNLLLHERNSLYVCLVLIGLPDVQKKDVLSHLFHLGCFVVDGYKEVSFRPDIKSYSHSLKTSSAYAVALILFHESHDALSVCTTSHRSNQNCRKRKQGSPTPSPRSHLPSCKLPPEPAITPQAAITDDVAFMPDDPPEADQGQDLPAIFPAPPSSHISKKVLFIGVRRPSTSRPIELILKSASSLSVEKRVDDRDEARCALAVALGYSTFTLDRKSSDSPFHVCADIGGPLRALDMVKLPLNSFVEICVDFFSMPPAYLAGGILSPIFFPAVFPSLQVYYAIIAAYTSPPMIWCSEASS